MGRKYDFDYIIIGGGPAGLTAAKNLAKAKKRVALIEGHLLGGANLNTRDFPYSLNLNFSHAYSALKDFPALGGQTFHYNFPTIVSHADHVITKLRAETEKSLVDAGVAIINGYAHFLDENTIAVGGTEYTASIFILATGAKLKTREITGLDTVNYLTPDTALKVRRLPKYVFVVGGGSTGCELATYFAELGAKVIIVERSHRLLPREDKEVSKAITEYFEKELNIMVITGSKVVAIEQDEISKRVIFNTAGQEKLVRIDCIVLATGSLPVTDYGLENAGVKYKNAGIVVDKSFRTSAPNIFAIGDATGNHDSSTARSEFEANVLAENLLRKVKSPINQNGFVRFVNSSPKVATVGFNEYDLLSSDHRYKKSIVYLRELPAVSNLLQNDYGFVKLLSDSTGRLLGGTIVGISADALAPALSLSVRNRQNASALAHLPVSTSDPAFALKLAAKKLLK